MEVKLCNLASWYSDICLSKAFFYEITVNKRVVSEHVIMLVHFACLRT